MSQTTYNIEGVGTLDLGRSLNNQQDQAVVQYFHRLISEVDFRNVPGEILENQEHCGTRISDEKEIYRPCCLLVSDPDISVSFRVHVEYMFHRNHRKAFAIKDFKIEVI